MPYRESEVAYYLQKHGVPLIFQVRRYFYQIFRDLPHDECLRITCVPFLDDTK